MEAQATAFAAEQNVPAAALAPEDTAAAASNVVDAAANAANASTPTTGIAETRGSENPE
jgi:hypothetical protein